MKRILSCELGETFTGASGGFTGGLFRGLQGFSGAEEKLFFESHLRMSGGEVVANHFCFYPGQVINKYKFAAVLFTFSMFGQGAGETSKLDLSFSIPITHYPLPITISMAIRHLALSRSWPDWFLIFFSLFFVGQKRKLLVKWRKPPTAPKNTMLLLLFLQNKN